MKKKLVLFTIVFLSICIGYLLGSEKQSLMPGQNGTSSIKRLNRLMNYIENDYVERINTRWD